MKKHKYTNALIDETSPYLLQHAHNPVNWYPWNETTLEKAKQENKLLLISIGYSACHWCHVMEHETFEDDSVAAIMNENFICVKVDREERPDVDQIYMTALHLMNQRGGWPLNCIAIPDGKPFWGGTYFQKEDWKEQIIQIANAYEQNPSQIIEFANRLSEGIQEVENVIMNQKKAEFSWQELDKMVLSMSERFDNEDGGSEGAPKFPMPNSYNFLLKYAHLADNKECLDHIEITLEKLAYGGIYDHIGGGFARYSVDRLWKVPHFEKMLYDNAQLVSLYSEAYLKFKNPLYKEVAIETLEFVERELMADEGAFFSALDADSEGEEGKFYIWKEDDLKRIIKHDYPIFKQHFNINSNGFWEHGNYILLRKESKEQIASIHEIDLEELDNKIKDWKKILLKERSKRVRPGLDDKSLTSWNGLMLQAYLDAYFSFNNKHYLDIALKNANFIVNQQMDDNGKLMHSYKAGKSTINGYLEDYSIVASAFIKLYQATYDEKWLQYCDKLIQYSITHFYDQESGMFFFTSNLDPKLVARKMEVTDNVIPASNSVMANALFDLGVLLDNSKYKNKAKIMLNNVKPDMSYFGYSNYGTLMLKYLEPFYEIAIVGNQANEKTIEFNQEYHPNKIFLGSNSSLSKMELLENKYIEGKTMIYVCENKVCQLPTDNINEAQKLLK
tara:strand:- start:749 stop:2767 length:2019 start_codon:yes stop_codon:yes gene_type:complete